MQTLAELGEAVAARRKALKLTQSFIAEKSGLTRETLSRFERGMGTAERVYDCETGLVRV